MSSSVGCVESTGSMAAAKRGMQPVSGAAVYTITHFFLGMVFGGLCEIALRSAQNKGGKGAKRRNNYSQSLVLSLVLAVYVCERLDCLLRPLKLSCWDQPAITYAQTPD